MTELKKVDTLLKRYLKGRFSVTQSLVVTFLITGAVSFGAGLSTEHIVTDGDQATAIVQGNAAAGDYTPSGTPTLDALPELPTVEIPYIYRHPDNYNTVFNKNIQKWQEICFAGDYGMWVDDGEIYKNQGTISNKGDFGALVIGGRQLGNGDISKGGVIVNQGIIKNDGDFGMFAVGGKLEEGAFDPSVVINGTLGHHDNFKPDHGHDENCEDGGIIENNGDVGMGAIEGAVALNIGLIKNNGNYGMLVSGGQFVLAPSGETEVSESQMGGYEFKRSMALNVGVYDKAHGHEGDHDDNCKPELVGGIIQNTGDVGMAALDGALAANLGGLVANTGNYGMVASGGVFVHKVEESAQPSEPEVISTGSSKPKYDFIESIAYNSKYGVVANDGMVGMAALDGGIAINEGLVKNGNDFGMVAVGGAFEPVVKSEHHPDDDCEGGNHKDKWDKDTHEPKFYESMAINEKYAVVENAGDVGMAALAGGLAINEGIVKNAGDVGMIAEGYAKYVPEDDCWEHDVKPKEDGYGPEASWDPSKPNGGWHDKEATIYHSTVINEKHGVVANAGDIGMAAVNGGLAKNYGLVKNEGIVGMLASGTDTLAINYGKDLLVAEDHKHDDDCGHDDHWADKGRPDGDKKKDKLGGIHNNGDYGMVAINGAGAINKGLIQNNGDVGMYIGANSYGENWGLDPQKDTCNEDHDHSEHRGGDWHEGTHYEVSAGIKNTGNIGVFVDGNGTFANYGTIKPGYNDGSVQESDRIAILTGTGNNVVKLGLTSDITGDLLNLGGTDILYLGSNPKNENPHYDEDGKEFEDNFYGEGNRPHYSKNSNTLDSNVWFYTHLVAGDPLKKQEDGSWRPDEHKDYDDGSKHPGNHKEFDWRVTGNIVLIPGAAVPGFEEDAGTLSYADYVQLVKDADVRKGLKGNLIVGEAGKDNTAEGANIAMIIGRQPGPGTQNLTTPTISGNSVNVEQSGKIINHTLDRAFITSADQLLVTNIYTNGKGTNDECYDGRENGGIMIDGIDLDKLESARSLTSEEMARLAANNINTNGELVIFDSKDIANGTHIGIQTDNLAEGWTGQYVYNKTTGELTLVVNRGDALGGFGDSNTVYGINTVRAAGGYDVADYPQSNLNEVNARRITDKGYLYARRAAFMAPVVTTVTETVQYPAAPMDKGVKAAPAVTEKGKEVAPPPVIEEVVETKVYKNYDNLQYAEVFGDWGNYSGSGAEYSYDTYGVTGATFHRFNPNWLAGLAYGYANSKVDYDNLNGSDEKIDTLGINGYVSYQNNNWLVTGQAGYAWSRHDLNRYTIDGDSGNIIGITDLKRKLDKKFDSNAATVGIEVGYNYKIDDNSYLYPYAGIDYVWNSRDSYSENTDSWTGQTNIADGDALDGYGVHIDKNDYNTAVTKLGLMGQAIYERWTFTGDIAWMHYFSDYDNTTGYYLDSPGAEFVSNKLDPGKDVGYIMLGADYAVNEQLTVGADFTGYYRSNQASSQVGLNLTYKF